MQNIRKQDNGVRKPGPHSLHACNECERPHLGTLNDFFKEMLVCVCYKMRAGKREGNNHVCSFENSPEELTGCIWLTEAKCPHVYALSRTPKLRPWCASQWTESSPNVLAPKKFHTSYSPNPMETWLSQMKVIKFPDTQDASLELSSTILPQPPKLLGLQARATTLGREVVLKLLKKFK